MIGTYHLLKLLSSLNNKFICSFVLSGFKTLRLYSPRSHRMTPTTRSPLSTTMGVINGVHGHTTCPRTATLPAGTAGFPGLFKTMVLI